MSPSADRNLLFGILALQMDFISRDQLVGAMNAWVLDKARPLGQILVEQRALAADEFPLLEALVQKHVQRHSDDAQKSLAAVGAAPELRQELEQLGDAEVQASLRRVPPGPQADPEATTTGSVGTLTSSGTRFRILRPHAKGGLGQVYVALDEELHREVALKEIQDAQADHPAERGRFLLEAEITGGLEHPGIVPVYGLGQYADGRPFYAMRFIRGDSLQEAIRRFHKADKAERDPGERALALRQLLGRFVDVCNAIAYAHSRGVLHRDLKPGNVMLGKYGETLVVDWGLAKATGVGGHKDLDGPPALTTGFRQPQRGDDRRQRHRHTGVHESRASGGTAGSARTSQRRLRSGGDAVLLADGTGAGGRQGGGRGAAAGRARRVSTAAAEEAVGAARAGGRVSESHGARAGPALCFGARVGRRCRALASG